ncbi:sigma-54 dependent transcriptional regulator [Heliomicrobium modesticaldum Ice1]|uniref:Sigma-54 dependent transcriptional regulator n=1 Tax=Heliobacterium modesticaldum (strain ATCC 51547 / Ice1) TaxID=498761 RepID=B0TAU8_HELMI|nr:sigma-54-dependent Fis family transcriptional regulator [Heliomicrobium modesticaldum]ABZ85059.1 sigma-54 dependent transcriptional regulator [Heliomicrobium modesticaldum Ice1]
MQQRHEIVTQLFNWVAIINASHNPIIATDHEGLVRVFNKAASRAFGKETRDVIGMPFEAVVPKCRLRETIQTGQPLTGLRFSYQERVFLVNLTPILRKQQLVGAVAIFQDMTELESVVEELNRVKELKGTLEAILEAAYDGIIVVNAEGIITMVNQACCNFLGFRESDLLGRHVANMVEGTRMHIVLQTGQAEVGDLQRTGGHDYIAMRIPIVKDGQVVGAVGKIMFKNVNELNALASKINSLQKELHYYKEELQKYRGARYSFDAVVGTSYAIRMIKDTARQVARTDSIVLLRGENGTGKQLLAHAMHIESERREGPFIQISCSGIRPESLEIELFGSAVDAPGASSSGKFALAHRGTLYITDIGDMPLPAQARLFRLLQGQLPLVDSPDGPVIADVRLIVSTNRHLEEMVRKDLFREDLYNRLNVISLFIPPLRDRKEDIPELVSLFIQNFNRQFGFSVQKVTREAMQVLINYHWPGNVRELHSLIERIYDRVKGDTIDVGHLPMHLQKFNHTDATAPQSQSLQALLEETEKTAILQALQSANGNKVQAAQLLGISRAGLYQKLAKYQIEE